jgi:hypothetical protein
MKSDSGMKFQVVHGLIFVHQPEFSEFWKGIRKQRTDLSRV